MMAMENAAGASALFDADGQTTLRFVEIHTDLGERAQAIIRYVNEKEAREMGQGEGQPDGQS